MNLKTVRQQRLFEETAMEGSAKRGASLGKKAAQTGRKNCKQQGQINKGEDALKTLLIGTMLNFLRESGKEPSVSPCHNGDQQRCRGRRRKRRESGSRIDQHTGERSWKRFFRDGRGCLQRVCVEELQNLCSKKVGLKGAKGRYKRSNHEGGTYWEQ